MTPRGVLLVVVGLAIWGAGLWIFALDGLGGSYVGGGALILLGGLLLVVAARGGGDSFIDGLVNFVYFWR
jgi:hypothetical protein